MTFEQFLANGGDREEKLVTIYKVHPEKLSDEYRSLLTAMDTPNKIVSSAFRDIQNPFHSLFVCVKNWDRIRSDLTDQGADFV